MLTPPAPDRLDDDALTAVLLEGWGVTAASVEYRPLGFGSHHWEVVDAAGTRWFVTADDLADGIRSLVTADDLADGAARSEKAEPAGRWLHAALSTALDLREEAGADFVVAPVRTRDGEPFVLTPRHMAVALYPFVDGENFDWGGYRDPEHRRGIVDLVIALHTAPARARRHTLTDDFDVPGRAELEAACDHGVDVPGASTSTSMSATVPASASAIAAAATAVPGPYFARTAALLAENTAGLKRQFAHYDELVREARLLQDRRVLTHGEPHPGNTMRTPGGWVLIDWDTALLAPPERDLWLLEPGDGSVVEAYTRATGITVLPRLLELYRIRWDLADLVCFALRFLQSHSGDAEDAACWDFLGQLTGRLPA